MIKKLLLACLILPGIVFAETTKIESINTVKAFGGGLQINLKGYVNDTPTQCGLNHFYLPDTDVAYETKRQIILGAFEANREIGFTFYGCVDIGSANFIRASSVLTGIRGPGGAGVGKLGLVKRIYPLGGRVNFRLDSNDCADATRGEYYYFESSDASASEWYSMLLTAASTGKRIRLSAETCDRVDDQNRHVRARYLYQDF